MTKTKKTMAVGVGIALGMLVAANWLVEAASWREVAGVLCAYWAGLFAQAWLSGASR